MRRFFLCFSLLAASMLVVSSCIEFVETDVTPDNSVVRPELPETPYDYVSLVAEIDEKIRVASPNRIPVSNEQAALGRVLFYDKHMSLNNAVSCASCHQQEKAFADNEQFSKGFGGKITPRNSMAIANIRTNNNLFWDSRVAHLQDLILEPVQNHIEMGMESVEALEAKLAKLDYYPELFQAAYGTSHVTGERISDAVAQFLSSMASTDAKFDRVKAGEAQFTALEQLGQELFMSPRTQCSSCHAGSNFSAPDFPGGPYGSSFSSSGGERGTANIGLDVEYTDNGRTDGKFKIPSLRNIALTAPYMHDGRFKTLEEVIDHYDRNVQPHNFLDRKFVGTSGEPKRLELNNIEREALVAFLRTLTDERLLTDERFSDPFEQ